MAFYVRLRKFFQQNDPHRLYLVKKIVVAFREDEDLIMDRLEQIYKDGGPSKLQSKSTPKAAFSYNDSTTNYSSQSSGESDSSNDNDEQPIIQGDESDIGNDTNSSSAPPKKSKKKLIILIVLAIVLAGGGYLGFEFFIKEKPSTEKTEENKGDEEKPVEKDETVTEPVVEEPQPVVVADTLADSLQIPVDSLTTDIDSTQNVDAAEEADNE